MLPEPEMKVWKVFGSVNRSTSEGWTFSDPVPSRMSDSSRVWLAESQTGPSRKLNPSRILVAVTDDDGSGLG